MRTLSIITVVLASATILAPAAPAQQGQPSVTGRWLVADGHAVIEIYRCTDKLCGDIAWAEPFADGAPLVDRHNPNAADRQRSLCGLTMLGDFRQIEANRWGDGWIYNAQNGKTYRATMTLADVNVLEVRGYVGIPLFGETQTWTRAPSGFPPCGHR